MIRSIKLSALLISTIFLITGCQIVPSKDSSSSSGETTTTVEPTLRAYYVDSPVVNVEYKCGKYSGKTEDDGAFRFQEQSGCQFLLGNILLREVNSSLLKDGALIFETDPKVSALLQSLDKNRMYGSKIEIDDTVLDALKEMEIYSVPEDDGARAEFIEKLNQHLDKKYSPRTENEAIVHMKQSLYNYREKDGSDKLVLTTDSQWLNGAKSRVEIGDSGLADKSDSNTPDSQDNKKDRDDSTSSTPTNTTKPNSKTEDKGEQKDSTSKDSNKEPTSKTPKDRNDNTTTTDKNSNQKNEKSDDSKNSDTQTDSGNSTKWQSVERIYTSAEDEKDSITDGDYTLLAWSELGMHCMDGSDYSIFSLLPPYNTLKAQLIIKGTSPRIVNADVTITYEAVAKDTGTLNSTSKGKTNFWKYADVLFPTAKNLAEDVGLKGKPTQSKTPVEMDYNISQNLYVAEGIPTTPFNDNGGVDEYPTVKVVAKDKDGNVLAETITTLPVSDEMNCVNCHNDNSDPKMDILQKHDKHFPDAVKDLKAKLEEKGFQYNEKGLVATVNSGTPILCASCHRTNAIAHSGLEGVGALTKVIHDAHAYRNDPDSGEQLSFGTDRNTCYFCHPGESTKCLRGAMGTSGKIECQSCHGNMEAVANKSRKGWVDEPNCQACHQDGKRYEKAVTDEYSGTLREAIDRRFATEQTLIDANNSRLYKYSIGHGGVACAGCHGSQHAIYPSAVDAENAQNIKLQGYKGTLRECGVCHKNESALTVWNGPHGLHTIGQRWVDMHGTVVLRNGTDSCKACHGQNLEGTHLSRVGQSREFKVGVLDKKVTFTTGEKVSCKKCHSIDLTGETK